MADEKPEKSLAELLAEIVKRWPKEAPKGIGSLGTMLGSIGPDVSDRPIDWNAALEALTKSNERREKLVAQRRAAETNTVDNDAANQWFREHWKDRKCPICQQVTWAMAPTFAHVATSLLGRHSPVSSFPCVVLTCRVCGNTLMFNAVIMNLLPEGAE